MKNEKLDLVAIKIGDICNFYGGLFITKLDGKFYWAITEMSIADWQEIPESLYWELYRLNKSNPS